MFFPPRAHTHTHIHADRYHVSYPAFCHGEIHSTIFHLSRPGSGKELMRDSAGDGTSRVGGSKKRRHVARWILVGREGNAIEEKAALEYQRQNELELTLRQKQKSFDGPKMR